MLNMGDNACVNILRLLNEETTHQLQRTVISDLLGLTNYQLNKYLVVLNEDLATVSDEAPSFIDEVNKGTWTGHNVTTYITQKIYLLYIKRSSLYPVFEFRAFYDNQEVKASVYAQEHFQTESTFYKNDRKLKKLLNEQHFHTVAGISQETEFVTRLRLFQLYYTTYTGIEQPLPELNTLSDQLITALKPLLVSDLKPTQTVKLETLLKVWVLRQQNHNLLTTERLSANLRDDTYHAISDALQRTLGSKFPVSTAEADYLFSFLLTQGFLGLNDIPYIEQNFPMATKLAKGFIKQLTDKSVLTADTDIMATGLYKQLLAVDLQFTTFISPKQISFFKTLYPTFDLLIRNFLSTLKQRVSFELSERMVVNLYFSYMFCLINTIPTTNIKDRVFICVDFSEGALYTNYVIRSLQAFDHAHIVIQRQLTDETNIYISDFRSMAVTVPQIIWLDPPTSQDWSELADVILDIKRDQLSRLFPDYDWSDQDPTSI